MAVFTVKDIVMRLLDVVDSVKEHIPDADYMQLMDNLKGVHDNVKEENAPGHVTYNYHSKVIEKYTQDIATLKKQSCLQADKIKNLEQQLQHLYKALDADEFHDAPEDIPIAHPIPSAPPMPPNHLITQAPSNTIIDADFAMRPPYVNNLPSKCLYLYKRGMNAGHACGDYAVCYRTRRGKGPATRGSCLFSVCSKHVDTATFTPLSELSHADDKFVKFLGPDPMGNGAQEYVVGI